jgi:hypothetical protein
MRIVIFCGVIACLLADNAVGDDFDDSVDDQLQVIVASAIVEIEPRPPGMRVLRLPTMEFMLRINADCANDLLAESVSISVADTRENLGAEALAEPGTIEKAIRIPRKQMGPLALENFCVADDFDNDATRIEVRDALSAQLSLKCVGESRQTIVYQTVALGVTLACMRPASD